MNLKDILITFQEWQLEKNPLNANFAHNGVANLFIEQMRVKNLTIPNVIVSFCPKCKSTHIKQTFDDKNWECWDCSTVWKYELKQL